MDPVLICPTHRARLSRTAEELKCEAGHAFELDQSSGVPTLFDPEYGLPFHSDSWDPLGRQPEDYPDLAPGEIDAFVQSQIPGSGGFLYTDTTLKMYPRPVFPLDHPENDSIVLDLGAGWGRWTFAAASQGWNVVAVDPWLDNCRAMRRVAKQLQLSEMITTLHADGRRLPLEDNSVSAAFSYSVLQHLPKAQARDALEEMVRVVRPGGIVRVQLPNVNGIRQRYLYRKGLVADEAFNVRPWTYSQVVELGFSLAPTARVTADGYFSLNAQWTERRAMRRRAQLIVAASEVLRRASSALPILVRVADSLWLELPVC